MTLPVYLNTDRSDILFTVRLPFKGKGRGPLRSTSSLLDRKLEHPFTVLNLELSFVHNMDK